MVRHRAAVTVMSWMFSLSPVCRVWATCDAANLASARVLEKLEMTREAVMRKAVFVQILVESHGMPFSTQE
jgi:RimJ/RimL family protein N-acetyltransferase